jgi:hypothetical protein
MSTSYAIFTFTEHVSDSGAWQCGRRFRVGGNSGIAMTIKLVMMAAMYCVIVLGPQLFPKAGAKQADRA